MLFVPELRILPDASDELPIPRLLNQLTVLHARSPVSTPLWRSNWRSFAAAGVEIKFHFQAKVLAFSFTLFFAYPLLLVFFFSLSLSLLPSTTVRRALLTSPANQQQQQQQHQLVINHFGSAAVCVCVQLCVCADVYVCVCKQRKLTKNINYVHEGRNLMRCRCRTEIEAAFLAKRSSRNPREEKHQKKSTRKAAERQHRKNKNNIIYACAFFAR